MAESVRIPPIQESRCKEQSTEDRKKWNSKELRRSRLLLQPNGFHQNFKDSKMAT